MNEFFVIGQAGQTPAVKTVTVVQKDTAAKNVTVQSGKTPAKKPAQPGFFDSPTLIFVIVIGAMFFMMWRGQSKERKRREEMLSALKAGDKVITAGGIYGVIDSVTADSFKILVSDNVRIEVSRNAVSRKDEPEKKDEPKKK